jgi:hypothetical protein
MKRWTLCFAVFLGALAVGLNIFLMTRKTGLLYPFRGAMPYCKVATNAESFHDSDIRVRARVIIGNGVMTVYENCDDIEALAASLTFDGTESISGPSGPDYVEKVLVTGSDTQVRTAEAIIEGRFDAHATTGCWAPKFRIAVSKLELVSEIIDHKPRGEVEGDGLRQKH